MLARWIGDPTSIRRNGTATSRAIRSVAAASPSDPRLVELIRGAPRARTLSPRHARRGLPAARSQPMARRSPTTWRHSVRDCPAPQRRQGRDAARGDAGAPSGSFARWRRRASRAMKRATCRAAGPRERPGSDGSAIPWAALQHHGARRTARGQSPLGGSRGRGCRLAATTTTSATEDLIAGVVPVLVRRPAAVVGDRSPPASLALVRANGARRCRRGWSSAGRVLPVRIEQAGDVHRAGSRARVRVPARGGATAATAAAARPAAEDRRALERFTPRSARPTRRSTRRSRTARCSGWRSPHCSTTGRLDRDAGDPGRARAPPALCVLDAAG